MFFEPEGGWGCRFRDGGGWLSTDGQVNISWTRPSSRSKSNYCQTSGRLGLISASLERCTQLEARPSHEIGPGDRHSPLNDIMRLVRQENTVLCLTEELCVRLSIQRRLWPKQNADRDINNPQSAPLCTRDDINKTVNIKSAQRE